MSEPTQPELLPAIGGSTVPPAAEIKPKVDLQANDLITQARALRDRVKAEVDLDGYYEAVELNTTAKDLLPVALDFTAEVKKTTHAAWKAAVAQEHRIVDPINEIRDITGEIMKRWHKTEEFAAAPKPDPDEQLAIEVARDTEVKQLVLSGQTDAAKDLAAQPLRQGPAKAAAVEMPGISYRDIWKGEIEDFGKAVRAIAGNDTLSVTLLVINQSALDDALTNSRGALKIDGIEVIKDSVPVNRR